MISEIDSHGYLKVTSLSGNNEFKRPLELSPSKKKEQKPKKFLVEDFDIPTYIYDTITFPDAPHLLREGGQGYVRRGVINYANYAVKIILKN